MKNDALAVSSLPIAWKAQPLAKVAAVFTDGNWIESKDQADSGIRLVQTGNVGIGQFKDRSEKARFIDEATFARLKCFEILPGDILISRLPDPVGRACIIPDTGQKMITAVDCSIVRVRDAAIDPKFLVYYSQTQDYLRAVDVRCSGTTRRRISRKNLGNVLVPSPPLDEQKRIVAVLDQAFATLDRARAHTEANLADAIDLKNRSMEYELSSETLGQPEPIGPHVDLLTGFAFKSAGYSNAPNDVRLIRGDNIVQGAFRWDGVKRWPIADHETHEKYELALDDVLIAMDRTWINAGIKYAIVDETALPSLLVQRVARLRAKQSVVSRYLGYWVGSKMFEKYVLSIQTGLGVPHVSGTQIENFPIRVPSVATQRAIVDRLDGIVERSRDLSSAYEQKLADLANLRQSLLQKAFSGQLT